MHSEFADEILDGPVDALLVVSFGGPERPDDVLPFLENVTRGRGIPRERLATVAAQYDRFGGRSPINDQNRALVGAITADFAAHGVDLPVYLGNRNWDPYLADAIGAMAADGIRNALAFVTSAYSSYSGCRQYRENIAAARAHVGPAAPHVAKVRHYFNHEGFVAPMVEATLAALDRLPADRRAGARLVFTAHSIPVVMAETCAYERQLAEAARLIASGAGRDRGWALVFQSRSGPPQVPWLGPDVGDHLEALYAEGVTDAVMVPIGFVSDHMEVVYDLDTLAAERAAALEGFTAVRAATVGTHPRFVAMIRELVNERRSGDPARPALGRRGPCHDVCVPGCCPAPRR